jgi:hypothetical protein
VTFWHWAEKPVILDRARIYTPNPERPYRKPVGLWFDVDGEWQDHCEGNELWSRPRVPHRVTLVPGANLIRLATPQDVLEFTETWSRAGADAWMDTDAIDWPAVQKHHDGILAVPFFGSFAFLHLPQPRICSWYWLWDVSSGCVWNLKAIATFKRDYAGTIDGSERNVRMGGV